MISIVKNPSATDIDSMFVNASGSQVLLQPEKIHFLADSDRPGPDEWLARLGHCNGFGLLVARKFNSPI
jgi:hypothetical protein